MRLVNELDAIKNKTHKTGGKKMKKKKVFALMMAATLAFPDIMGAFSTSIKLVFLAT